MKVSLRTQFFFLVVPFVGALLALVAAGLAPYFSIHQDILQVESDLECTLAVQQFADSFADQTREYADFIVSGASSDADQFARAAAASRRSLAAWRRLAEDDRASEVEIVQQVSAGHTTVTDIGATIVRLRRDGRQAEAAALLSEQAVPLATAVMLKVDQNLVEHQNSISRAIARIAGGIGYSRILQFKGVLQGIEDLDSHIAEVLESAAYKRAIEAEVRGVWSFFLSKDHGNVIDADHERVIRAYAALRLAVKNYGSANSFGGPEQAEELRFVDDLHRQYLVLHGNGETVIQLVRQRSDQQARALLLRHLEFDNTAVAKALQEYTAHETEVARENVEYLKRGVRSAQRTLVEAALVLVLIGLGVPWFFSRRMIKPILDLQQAALRIGGGDLETRITVPSTIELASLATTFNAMAGELKISRNEDLKKSEERFKLAARSSNDVIWDWDVPLDQLWLDDTYRESVGLVDQCFSVAQWLGSIHPDDRQRLERGVRGVIAGADHFWSDEYRFQRADGTYAQKSNRGYIVRDADGKAMRMIGAVTDITERRNAEQAIANLHRQKELILNSVGDGIVGLDPDGRITSANPAAVSMLGYKEDELLGRPVHDVVQGDEEFFRRADGSTFAADYASNPMYDDHRNVIGAVVTFRDITVRYEVDRLKSQFVSTVSHELRTPLTSIRGALGLLSGGLLGSIPAKGQRMLDIAVSNTDRLVRLINDILDVERIDSGTMEMSRVVVGAFNLMKAAAEGVQSMADAAGVTLVIEPTAASILADADRIMQTLTNLLGNAIKFSPRDTTVALSAAAGGEECTFRVADQGRGIPDDKLEMIFERFQQVDASDSRDKGGSGLGLAICRSIVNAHGGRIRVQRNEPAGAVFQFTIPSAVAPMQLTEDDLLDAVAEDCGAPSILVVEDDLDLARVMTAILQNHGIRTFHAANGSEAVDLCRQHEPSLIVLDLVLPDMDGFAVVSSLKESATLRRAPLLVYSGMDVGVADQKRLRLGPTEFLTKSRASLQEFESRVVRLLHTITTHPASTRAIPSTRSPGSTGFEI